MTFSMCKSTAFMLTATAAVYHRLPGSNCSSRSPTTCRDARGFPLSRRKFCEAFLTLLTAQPAVSETTTSEYDRHAHTYDILDGSTMFTRGLGFDDLRSSVLFNSYGDVLELGAGTGVNILFYPDTIKSLTALDTSPAMLHIASLRHSRQNSFIPAVRFIVGDAANTHLSSSSFDTIVITFGLCVFDDPLAVLREAHRLLKRDGTLLIIDYTRSSFGPLAAYQSVLSSTVTRLSKGCTPDLDVRSLVRQAGFTITSDTSALVGTIVGLQGKPVKK